MGNLTCADIQIVNDTILESVESFTVMLVDLDSSNIVITTASSNATVTINEDSTDCKCCYAVFVCKALGTINSLYIFEWVHVMVLNV